MVNNKILSLVLAGTLVLGFAVNAAEGESDSCFSSKVVVTPSFEDLNNALGEANEGVVASKKDLVEFCAKVAAIKAQIAASPEKFLGRHPWLRKSVTFTCDNSKWVAYAAIAYLLVTDMNFKFNVLSNPIEASKAFFGKVDDFFIGWLWNSHKTAIKRLVLVAGIGYWYYYAHKHSRSGWNLLHDARLAKNWVVSKLEKAEHVE